ncbi:unnamed protein product [Durusdinium trenchii]|uniref:Uncharacterized protein n=1 Tax=Durusdinium trenchii TaxID=1381693 RepID=A0ABP0SW59_9DINO
MTAVGQGCLQHPWQVMHEKAWNHIKEYMENNLHTFTGRSLEAESTILPSITTWVHDALNAIPEVRSASDHCLVVWLNLPTSGVTPAAKMDFFLTAVSNILASHKRNSIAIVVHGNRASDTGSSKIEKTEKDEDDTTAKKEEPDDEEGGDNQTDGDSEEADPENPEEADIRDVRHKLEKALAAKDRNLCVKNVTWVFDQASVYGKRDACVAGLAVVHRDKLNMFRGTSGWKHGLIRDVAMLPRSQMYKPEATTSTPHLGRAFTDAQELRQVAGGTDFVKKTLGTFLPDSVSTTLVIDLHCYDCWPALAALEECAAGRRLLCGSVVLDKQPDTMVQRIANKVYESCRAEQLKIVGFPSFAPLIQAIQQVKPDDQEKKYEDSPSDPIDHTDRADEIDGTKPEQENQLETKPPLFRSLASENLDGLLEEAEETPLEESAHHDEAGDGTGHAAPASNETTDGTATPVSIKNDEAADTADTPAAHHKAKTAGKGPKEAQQDATNARKEHRDMNYCLMTT